MMSVKYLISVLLGLFMTVSNAIANPIITLLEKTEPVPAGAVRLRTITMSGNDPARSCAYFEIQQDAYDSARSVGANLIHEDVRIERSRAHPCEEVTFSFYKVSDIKNVERRLSWTADRRLVWEDFKGGVPANAANTTAAETSCGIGVETNTVSSINLPKVYVFNTFQTFSSWVRPAEASVDVLQHEQGHWDICELYTRKMRERFAQAHIDVKNLQRVVNSIYSSTQREYAARQEQYERETKHGILREPQQRWTDMLAKELGVSTP